MKKILAFILLTTFFPLWTLAQSYTEKRGDKYFDRLAYVQALHHYMRAAKRKSNNHVYERIGDCYRLMGHIHQSEGWYQKVAESGSPTTSALLHYAEALRSNERYKQSQFWMAKYYSMNPSDGRAKEYIETDFDKLLNQEPFFAIRHLSINTDQPDFGATFVGNRMVFVSSRLEEGEIKHKQTHAWNNMPFLNLFDAVMDTNGELSDIRVTYTQLNTKYHEGPACFTHNGKEIYFTRNNYFNNEYREDSRGINNLKIYRAKMVDGKWEEEDLPFNSDEYSAGHPALSHDGKYLYFVSDMPGGYGHTDIYRVAISGDAYGRPENLGETINTEGIEMFPYVDGDGNLYFASSGQVGLGGLDVFYAAASDKGWAKPLNPGRPVNSSFDDFALVLDSSGNSGYLSSNRQGGSGYDDLYAVKKLRSFKTKCILNGIVKDRHTGKLLDSADVVLKDSSGAVVAKIITDTNGYYRFEVQPGKNYLLTSSRNTYSDTLLSVHTRGMEMKPEKRVDLELQKKPALSLLVTVKDKASGLMLGDVKIVITDNISGVSRTVLSSATGAYRMEITNKKPGDRISYNIAFEKQNYLSKTITHNVQIEKYGEIRIDEALDKIAVGLDLAKIIDIKPIYFDYGKSTIRKDAAIELDKIVKVLNDNPNMVIELGSHTDCRGTINSNKSLSNRRAVASAAYIQKRITNPSRISGTGYGESQVTNACECEGALKSTCSEDEHSKNRRTEFRIMKM